VSNMLHLGTVNKCLDLQLHSHTCITLVADIIFRVTTYLENLEKSGKMEKIREKSGEVKLGVFFQALNAPKLVFRPGLPLLEKSGNFMWSGKWSPWICRSEL